MEKSMKLIFRADGAVFQTATVEKGERVMAIDPPEKEGYRFVEWRGLPSKSIPGREVTVDAVYEPQEYNAVFKVDGKEVASEKIRFGDPVTAPAADAEKQPGQPQIPQLPLREVPVQEQVHQQNEEYGVGVDRGNARLRKVHKVKCK